MRFTFFSDPSPRPVSEAASDGFTSPFSVLRTFCRQVSELWFACSPSNQKITVFFGLRGINAGAVFAALMFQQGVLAASHNARAVFDHGVYTGGLDLCDATVGLGGYQHCENFYIWGDDYRPLAQGVYGVSTSSQDYAHFSRTVNVSVVESLIKDLIQQDPDNVCANVHKGCVALYRWVQQGIRDEDDPVWVEARAVVSGLREPACRTFQKGFSKGSNSQVDLEWGAAALMLIGCAAFLLFAVTALRRGGQPVFSVPSLRKRQALPPERIRCLREQLKSIPFFEVPPHLCCPVTLDVMWDPVRAADGKCYDRSGIEPWLAKNKTSPLTRERLIHRELCPDFDKQKEVEVFLTAILLEQSQVSGDVVIEMPPSLASSRGTPSYMRRFSL